MARTPLPITMADAESLFRDAGIEFAPAPWLMWRARRLRSRAAPGNAAIELVGDKERPPHLTRAVMTLPAPADLAALTSALGAWYRLADAVSASSEVGVMVPPEHVVGPGGQWWALKVAKPFLERTGGTDPWVFVQDRVPLDRKDPQGAQLVFTFRRWTGKRQHLRIETEGIDAGDNTW